MYVFILHSTSQSYWFPTAYSTLFQPHSTASRAFITRPCSFLYASFDAFLLPVLHSTHCPKRICHVNPHAYSSLLTYCFTPSLELLSPLGRPFLCYVSVEILLILLTGSLGINYEHWLQGQITQVQIPARPLVSCVALGKLVNLSMPQFPYL